MYCCSPVNNSLLMNVIDGAEELDDDGGRLGVKRECNFSFEF